MATRVKIAEFGIIQKALGLAVVTFYIADEVGENTGVRAVLYQAETGPATIENPQTLDEDGKLRSECWVETQIIAAITGITERTERSVKKIRQNPLEFSLPVTCANWASQASAELYGDLAAVQQAVADVQAVLNDPGFIAVSTDLLGDDDIGTVADNIAGVAAVASDLLGADNIGTVAANLNGSDTIGEVAGSIANVNAVGGDIANVNIVATNIANVNAVAGNASNINTVAGDIADVVAVAGSIANVNIVATDLAGDDNIGTVADEIADVGTVAAAIANVNTVAGSISQVGTVAGSIAAVQTVAGIDTEVSALAAISANITTVAGIAANVTTVAGIDDEVVAVAGVAGSVSALGPISANITTVAGIDDEVTTVAGIASAVSTVSGISANVSTVAGIASAVSTVAGIDTEIAALAAISSNITTVAGISAAVSTVAGISSSVSAVAAIDDEVQDVAAAIPAIVVVAANLAGADTIGDVAANIANVNTVAGIEAEIIALASITADIVDAANNIPKANRTATTNPTVNDDVGDGYSDGSMWVNTSTNQIFLCADSAAGAAVWENVTAAAAASLASMTDVSFSGLANGDMMRYNGSAWVNRTAAQTRTDLGLAIGTNVQAYSANLAAIAALAVTDSNIIVGNGTTWVAESGATARTSLGVGTGDSPQFTGVNIGHASDTTISRVSSGIIAVEGNNVLMANNIGVSVQAYSSVLQATTASFTSADETKLDYISITQAVDLDALELRVAQLDAAVVLKGTWDASGGSFPGSGSAQSGESWIVSVGGTVDGQVFVANDRIIAITDNASTSTFAANWFKADYTDQVLSVAGRTGAVTLAQADISGLTTADSPQFAGINLGHASDTTFTRVSAGVAAIEGNNILTANLIGSSVQAYNANLAALAGLTGVADRGVYFTGAGAMTLFTLTSTARSLLDDTSVAAMATTLGLGTGSSPQFTAINLGHASDTTIARVSAGVVSIEGNNIYTANGTDVAVADGGTGRSSAKEYAVLCGGTTATGAHQSVASVGTSGQVLTSNGAGALPTFQNPAGGNGRLIDYKVYTASGTWTKPAGAVKIRVRAQGAGGAASGRIAGGHGGAGGNTSFGTDIVAAGGNGSGSQGRADATLGADVYDALVVRGGMGSAITTLEAKSGGDSFLGVGGLVCLNGASYLPAEPSGYGAGAGRYTDGSGCAGNGGCYVDAWIDAADLGSTETITIGAAGIGGSGTSNTGIYGAPGIMFVETYS